MKLIYCASPARLSSNQKQIMDFVTSQGLAPFHPFQAFEYDRYEGGPIGREKTMEFCIRAVETCNEFWLIGVSEGTLRELKFALEAKKQIRVHLDSDKSY